MILANFYNQKPQGCSKIITHIMFLLILADLLWLIFFASAWVHEKNLKDSPEISQYWDSLLLLLSSFKDGSLFLYFLDKLIILLVFEVLFNV